MDRGLTVPVVLIKRLVRH